MEIKKYSALIFSIVLFLISATSVFLIYPKERKFAYSFNEGSPWLHDDLMADKDFAVYKTTDELNQEKDSIKKSLVPFFSYDSLAIGKFQTSFINPLSELIDSQIQNPAQYFAGLFDVLLVKRKFDRFQVSIDSLGQLSYAKGIIRLPDSVQNINKFYFYLFNGETSILANGNNFVNLAQFSAECEAIYNKSGIKQYDSVSNYSVQRFLNSYQVIPNIVYDAAISKKVLDSKLDAISPVSGLVKSGQLIIRKGNIVGDGEYKILMSIKSEFEKENVGINNVLVSSGTALIFLSFFLVIFLYLLFFHRNILLNFRDNTFLSIQMILLIFSVFIVFAHTDFNINVIPFALFPLIILTFYNFHIAFIIYLASILIAGFFAPNNFEFVFTQVIVGLIAMYSLKSKKKRSQIFISMALVFITYAVLWTGFSLIKQGEFDLNLLRGLIPYAISSFLILLYLPLIYFFEKLFGYISDFSLLELSDTNNAALRLLAEKAPGTFQHSIQVANLVESVVRELGGNYLLARTGALYHDIGKTVKPEYYIENQSGNNLHDNFDFEESAQKIISHVQDGLVLARKYALPSQISDFIKMHHGTSVTKYFYNSWVNENPDTMPVVSNFKYPGPKPQSLETAVMMMADAIEAASRTIIEFTPETIGKLCSSIIDSQLADGQFDEVEISLKQITIAKKTFAQKISNIYHARIIYPELNNSKKL